MKTIKIFRIQSILIFTLMIASLIISCSKKFESQNNTNETLVIFDVTEINNNQQSNIKNKASINTASEAVVTQVGIIRFSKDLNLVYELIPENQSNVANHNLKASTSVKSNSLMANNTIKKALEIGVKYRVLAYDSDGNLKGDKTYIYSPTSSQEGMALDAGEKYTFIAYSINSKTDLPTIEGEDNLNTVKLTNVTGDLMYFKDTKTLALGSNYLNISLKHQFSSITTTLKIQGPYLKGSFEAIENAFFNNTSKDATLSFNDNVLSYNTVKTNIENTFIDYVGKTVITSQPTILINEASNTHTLTFGKLQIGQETKTGADQTIIEDIKITPGVKYNLVLTFKTCLESITPTALDWRCSEPIGNLPFKGCRFKNNPTDYVYGKYLDFTYTNIPNADDGFIFDIYNLDNSLNMTVNGMKISDEEIQFQKVTAQLQNIRFKDGDRYGYESTNEKHKLDNTENGPTINETNKVPVKAIQDISNDTYINNKVVLIKILISKNGEVQMFGRKSITGDFEELQLFDIVTNEPLRFNSVIWHQTSSSLKNEVKISQLIDGPTILIGDGYGKKKTPCNP